MSFNKFAAGAKRYGQGASSPTRGQVDPSGYIKRELARNSNQRGVSRMGSDGQSDTRSGLAHQAMQRNGMYNNTGRPQASSLNAPKGQPMQGWQPPSMAPSGQVTTNPNMPTATPVAPSPVQVSANGQLNLPYDSEFYAQAMDAQGAFDDEMMTIGQEEQQQALDYSKFMRDLESGYTDRQRGTLGNTAGRGMLYSSQYTTAANEDATTYNNSKNDAVNQNTQNASSLASRRTAAQNYLNQMLQRASQGYADSLAANSGNLGFGTDEGMASPSIAAMFPGGGAHLGNNGPRPQASSIKPPKPPKHMVEAPKPPKKKGKK